MPARLPQTEQFVVERKIDCKKRPIVRRRQIRCQRSAFEAPHIIGERTENIAPRAERGIGGDLFVSSKTKAPLSELAYTIVVAAIVRNSARLSVKMPFDQTELELSGSDTGSFATSLVLFGRAFLMLERTHLSMRDHLRRSLPGRNDLPIRHLGTGIKFNLATILPE